ncbi:DUF2264 domain-containing protein [Paenibacillus sp. UNC451MF]|uniref:DUF2264 domain-containing protein n=1 Tax=Paenibacillus sp. UNC451MF TaxID=1449063 RepID=UPI00048BA0CC|nr:DUF2264 domain-containing protein [Paenibacillus sp. UNC451MF]
MKTWDLPITHNPLRTRDDLRQAFLQLSDPLKPYYTKGSTRLYIGNTGTSYTDDVAGMEGFSRVLWGLVPLLAGGDNCDLWDIYVQGIKNGTDSTHEEYWGDVVDYDQRLVEMAAYGFALALIPEKIKSSFSEQELQRLTDWLDQISSKKLWDCNWLFFLVLVQMGFKKAGLPYNQPLMEQTLGDLDRFYLTEGWYADGVQGHSDYYVPFALHYYGLLYAKLMEADDAERSRLYKSRALEFAHSFIQWFDEDGAALPYGRSLAYRFSQAAFWSALVFAGVEPFSLGVMKGLILRNLRWWFQQPMFHPDGTLSIGYAYSNLIMAENYNSPGSPYWALKTFLPLALDENHPFWTAEELPLPKLPRLSVQQPPHLVICRDEEHPHVLAFNPGHIGTNEHTHTSAKYEKFVYSTFFGFSVPRAEWGLAQGAFDSMLAISEGDNLYRVKRKTEESLISENGTIYTRWKPWLDVEVQTWLIPGTPWHIRVHRIDSSRTLDLADGGFALGIDQGRIQLGSLQVDQRKHAIRASNDLGSAGVQLLYGTGTVDLITPHSNTNLMHPRTVIPTVKMSIKPGSHWLVTAVYGEPFSSSAQSHWKAAPSALVAGNELLITMSGSSIPVFKRALD